MKAKALGYFLLTALLILGAATLSGGKDRVAKNGDANKPVKLIGAIFVPGNPLRFDISWVDQPLEGTILVRLVMPAWM